MTEQKTIAARVDLDLREDAIKLAERDHGGDLSTVLRTALRQYVDRALHAMPDSLANGLFQPAAGASHRGDPATSRRAGRDVAPRTGSDRLRALQRIAAAGHYGRTADELLELDEAEGRQPAGNGPARRVSELKAAGAIVARHVEATSATLADGTYGDVVTRPTRNGSDATVYIATAKGLRWLAGRA